MEGSILDSAEVKRRRLERLDRGGGAFAAATGRGKRQDNDEDGWKFDPDVTTEDVDEIKECLLAGGLPPSEVRVWQAWGFADRSLESHGRASTCLRKGVPQMSALTEMKLSSAKSPLPTLTAVYNAFNLTPYMRLASLTPSQVDALASDVVSRYPNWISLSTSREWDSDPSMSAAVAYARGRALDEVVLSIVGGQEGYDALQKANSCGIRDLKNWEGCEVSGGRSPATSTARSRDLRCTLLFF